jgi:hypothetical protein
MQTTRPTLQVHRKIISISFPDVTESQLNQFSSKKYKNQGKTCYAAYFTQAQDSHPELPGVASLWKALHVQDEDSGSPTDFTVI